MRSVSRWVVAVIAATVALGIADPGRARAERTAYGWLLGTELLPERGAEITSWLDEENGREPGDIHWTTWGWSAFVGVTDQLVLGFPLEMLWRDSDALASPSFTLHQYGVEARYRFVTADPVEAPAVVPLGRIAIKRDVTTRDTVVGEADLVVSTTTPSGSVMMLLQIGFVGAISDEDTHVELRPGAGVSFQVVGDLRLGAEAFSEVSLDSSKETWAAVGPNLAWSHGRFWLSAAFGIGVYQIDTAPRMQWGVMF